MKYRAEIDGLRAVAIIPVLMFHAGFQSFGGGFIGVDVFFVISGYLITGIIFSEIQAGTYSIWKFYERRARRILPALFAMCLACLIPAWIWLLPQEFEGFSASLLSVIGFGSNMYFWSETGYFDTAGGLKPLLHTWSLAVEEQFYIVLPLVLWLLRRWTATSIASIIALLCLASLGLAQYWSVVDPEANFYLLPSRFWELGIGALIALVWRDRGVPKTWADEALAMLGLTAIISAALVFDAATPTPSAFTLLPVFGTALTIMFASSATLVGKLLSLRPLVAVGLISYSLYLWHQPLFAFARIRMIDGVGDWMSYAILIVVFPIAYVSWRFVEQPFRGRNLVWSPGLAFLTIAPLTALIGIGVLGLATGGLPARLDNRVIELAAWAKDKNRLADKCHSSPLRAIPLASACDYGTPAPHRIALLGDSHANQLAPLMAAELKAHAAGMLQMTFAGCLPAPGYYRSDRQDDCDQFNIEVRNYLLAHAEIDTVILNARWTAKLVGTSFDNGEGPIADTAIAYAIPIGAPLSFALSPDRIPAVGAIYRKAVQTLLDAGKKVVLIYPEPEAGWDVPTYLARKTLYRQPVPETLSTSYQRFKDWNRPTYEQFDLLADHPNLLRLKPEDIFCNAPLKDRCVNELDGKLLYFDDDHFSTVGVKLLAKHIAAEMQTRGWLK